MDELYDRMEKLPAVLIVRSLIKFDTDEITINHSKNVLTQ